MSIAKQQEKMIKTIVELFWDSLEENDFIKSKKIDDKDDIIKEFISSNIKKTKSSKSKGIKTSTRNPSLYNVVKTKIFNLGLVKKKYDFLNNMEENKGEYIDFAGNSIKIGVGINLRIVTGHMNALKKDEDFKRKEIEYKEDQTSFDDDAIEEIARMAMDLEPISKESKTIIKRDSSPIRNKKLERDEKSSDEEDHKDIKRNKRKVKKAKNRKIINSDNDSADESADESGEESDKKTSKKDAKKGAKKGAKSNSILSDSESDNSNKRNSILSNSDNENNKSDSDY
jgi:hypothetical protein